MLLVKSLTCDLQSMKQNKKLFQTPTSIVMKTDIILQ
jgi:hypothetical protein